MDWFLADYVARQTAPAVLRRMEAHLSNCPECRGYLAKYRASIAAARAAAADAVGLPEALARAILAARE